MAYAQRFREVRPGAKALDIGCGAGRNTVPLALAGYAVLGIDLSAAMVRAAREKAVTERAPHCALALGSMAAVPIQDQTIDLIVAHGIWNLSQTDDELRRAMGEAGRAARSDARLIVYTFARRSLLETAQPVTGQQFIFAATDGAKHCYLTPEQLVTELARVGFAGDPAFPAVEHNAPRAGAVQLTNSPVFLEAAFIRRR